MASAGSKVPDASEALYELLLEEIVNTLKRGKDADAEPAQDDAPTDPPAEPTPEDVQREQEAMKKFEAMGYHVGQGLFESQTRGSPRFSGQLDLIKFVCKDFWTTVFQKQVDNLRTNHKGVYVLQDNEFRILRHIGSDAASKQLAQQLLAFPCGLIRGGLASVGLIADVKAEIAQLPACRFNIEVRQ
eukprot:m.7652 g.7652  ORF g.7652 m.7652 type:complete len:187 (+) comp3004_c0_seq2:86-646(+)